MDKPEEE